MDSELENFTFINARESPVEFRSDEVQKYRKEITVGVSICNTEDYSVFAIKMAGLALQETASYKPRGYE